MRSQTRPYLAYLASHLLGHFELLAAWPLPAFAWALRRASLTGSKVAVAAAAAVLIATAYTTYYYVVYLALFALTWLVASTGVVSCSIGPRPPSSWIHMLRAALIALIAGTSILVLWILSTGGAMVTLGPLALSVTRTHNPLTFALASVDLSVAELSSRRSFVSTCRSRESCPRRPY